MPHKHCQIKAEDIMTEIVVTVREDVLVRDAAHLMFRDKINAVPVVDADQAIVGLLTLRDLIGVIQSALGQKDTALYNKLVQGTQFYVHEIMTRDVLTISPSATLDDIVYLTLEMRVFTFPVMDGKKLVGILGVHDILNAVFNFI